MFFQVLPIYKTPMPLPATNKQMTNLSTTQKSWNHLERVFYFWGK